MKGTLLQPTGAAGTRKTLLVSVDESSVIKQQWRTWMRVLSVSMGKKTQCSATPAQEPATMCPATERPSPSSAESERSVKPAPAYEDKSGPEERAHHTRHSSRAN